MIKILIVEDESLVQIGIQSMVNQIDMDIEVCGVVNDGLQALDMIEETSPQIIITDIKMPRMDGLELIKTCRLRYGNLHEFIILTSYEEFQFLKEAMKYDIIDYLIKLELNQNNLTAAIKKALSIIKEKDHKHFEKDTSITITQPYLDKFFIKLLFNLFENEEQTQLQAKELNLNFQSSAYVVSHCEIVEYSPMWKTPDKNRLLNLYTSTIQMVRNLINKYLLCYVTSLDTKHFSLIFCLAQNQKENYKEIIKSVLKDIYSMVHKYFNVTILTSISCPIGQIDSISEAYQDARQIFSSTTVAMPIVFYDDSQTINSKKNSFNVSLFKNDIRKAFEEFDTETLSSIFNQIIDIFKDHQTYYLQSIDAACSILYLSISLLPKGEEIVAQIFKDDSDGYRSVYRQTTVEQVIEWLIFLKDGLLEFLSKQKNDSKNRIVLNVKKYIENHVKEKLTLTDVASEFNITPNYLSQLFKKYNDIGFSEYITLAKINKAKSLIIDDDYKIYEIANILGFENAYYFSKVFKKVVGCTPSQYMHNHASIVTKHS